MLRLLTAISVGVLVGGILLTTLVGDPDTFWILMVGLMGTIFLGILTGIAVGMRGVLPLSAPDVDRAAEEGRLVPARIESIRRTGTLINDVPVCELRLVVAPYGRDAYGTTAKALVDPIASARYQPGTVLPVVMASTGRPEVALAPLDHPTAHDRMRGPTTIPPASHAPEWTEKGSAPGPRSIIPMGRSGRPMRIAVYALCALVAAAVVVLPSREPLVRAVSGVFDGVDVDDFSGGENAAYAVDALIEETGGTMFVAVRFYDGYVLAEAPTSPGAITVDDFQFRYGVASRTGPGLIQPEDIAVELFDVTEIDFSTLPGLVAEARRLTGLPEGEADGYVFIERASSEDDSGRRPIEIDVSLNGVYFSGSVTTDVNGEIIRMSSEVPGSEAGRED